MNKTSLNADSQEKAVSPLKMDCRHCKAPLKLPLVDLGTAPPSNDYISDSALVASARCFPLRVLVCDRCWLVQTEDFAKAGELFDAGYAYFSSFSTSWLVHSEKYVDAMIERFHLGASSHVVEVAANDGYLLQYVKARGIPCTGIEPTASTAAAARAKGLRIIEDFFGVRLASEFVSAQGQVDLIAANNVLAHVPDINDFVKGFSILLKPDGVATFEFPHLFRFILDTQFDTIYHEHYSYLSLTTVSRIFVANGLAVFDAEELSTHGGSLRIYAQRQDAGKQPRTPRLQQILDNEAAAGMCAPDFYAGFQARANKVRSDFRDFIRAEKAKGRIIAGYGAAAKGNTLLNYAGIVAGDISFIVDRNPVKQGKYCPGSGIPIVGEDRLMTLKPDYVVIFPWNLTTEVVSQLHYVRDWGGRFVTAIPELRVID